MQAKFFNYEKSYVNCNKIEKYQDARQDGCSHQAVCLVGKYYGPAQNNCNSNACCVENFFL